MDYKICKKCNTKFNADEVSKCPRCTWEAKHDVMFRKHNKRISKHDR